MTHKKNLLAAIPILLCLLLLAACTTQLPPSRLPNANEETFSVVTVPLSPHDTEDTPYDSESTLSTDPVSITLKNSSPLTGIDAGSVTGAGSYIPGSKVTLTATPEVLGYQFGGWYCQNERLSTQATYTFTVPNAPIELTATWIPRDDIADFSFTATADECIITGLKNPNKTELIIPDYVTELAPAAFQNCTSLIAIAIPEGISHLPDSLFYGCTALTDLSYSHSFQSIGQNAFLGCDSLHCSTYGNTRYLAGDSPFTWLIGLTDPSVTECAVHPDTKYITKGAFMNSPSLQTVTFPQSAAITELPAYAFSGCSSLSELSLPEGLQTIGKEAFVDCVSLQEITLPSSLRSVGENAFYHCKNLDNICYLGTIENWETISVGETNRLFELTPIHCEDGDSIYPIRLYGRSLLFGDDAYLYDLIEAAVMAESPLPSVSVDSELRVTTDQCSAAYDVFLHDYPECFWAGNSLAFSTDTETGRVHEIIFDYTFEGNELAEAKTALNAVVEEILRDMPEGSPFEQTLYLHDAVAERVVYRSNPLDQTSYGALVGGEAVCAGYAGAYQLLLQSAGYKAWSVSGFAGEPHRWNVVWLDHNTCVYTDVTWDDSESFPISHGYFGLSLSEISEDHMPNDPHSLPSCSHDDHGYEDLAEIPVVTDNTAVSAIYGAMTEQNEGYLAVFYYTGSDLDAWIGDHLNELASHLGWQSISVSYRAVRNEIFLTLKP